MFITALLRIAQVATALVMLPFIVVNFLALSLFIGTITDFGHPLNALKGLAIVIGVVAIQISLGWFISCSDKISTKERRTSATDATLMRYVIASVLGSVGFVIAILAATYVSAFDNPSVTNQEVARSITAGCIALAVLLLIGYWIYLQRPLTVDH